MKKLFVIVGAFLLFVACDQSNLDKQSALRMLQEQKGYPKTIDSEIYIADPADAKRLLDAGLEKDGYVKIAHTQKLIDVGKPIITFTEKAKPYLIAQTKEDKKNNVQRIKVAIKVVDDVLSVKLADDGKSAVVEFKSSFNDRTPFFRVSRIDENGKITKHIEIELH
jgi:hypothetical protein